MYAKTLYIETKTIASALQSSFTRF